MFQKIVSFSLIVSILFFPIQTAFAQAVDCSSVNANNVNACCFTNSNTTAAVQAACIAYYSGNSTSTGTTNTGTSSNGQVQQSGTNGTGLNGNNSPSYGQAATTAGLTGGGQYTPTVQLNFGSQGKGFGGLTFKGVGGALVSCTGFGTFLGNAVGKVVNAAKTAVITGLKAVGGAALGIAEGIPYIGGFIKGIAGGIGSAKPKPGDDVDHPLHTKDDAIQQKAACLDGIAYVLSQQVLQQITNRTLHWANTGFGGNPLYVKDIDSYLLSIRNQKVNSFLQSAQNSDPIFGNAIRSVVTLQVTGRSDGLLNKSLTTPQAAAYNSFMTNFTNGGWNALLNPSYNPIGALFNASGNLSQSINTAQLNSQNELQRNNGFLDMKTCVQYANNGQVQNAGQNGAGLSGNATPQCTKYETVTPGSIVAMMTGNILNSPTRQAELATQFNEAVGSFFDALLNQLFSRGLSGLKGTANQADIGLQYGGVGNNTVLDTNGNPIQSVNANVADLNSIAAGISGTVDISHPQLLRAVLQTQYDYYNKATDAALVLTRLAPELGRLDYCVPGPNPDWQTGLSSNFSGYLSNAQFQQAGGSSTAATTGLSLYDNFTSNSIPVGNRALSITGTGDAKGYIQTSESQLATDLNNKFGITALAGTYAATQSNQTNKDYASGMAAQMYGEVTGLTTFAQNAVQAEQNYQDRLTKEETDIAQLQAIYTQVNQIVATAKTRYTQAQKAAGTPINQQCLDRAYMIDTSAVTGTPRQEPNTASPIVQQFLDANKYFYSTL